MRNATAEITEFVNRNEVLAAQVSFKPNSQVEVDYQYRLGDNWKAFCQSLDFQYDAGYGTQHLFGTIWFQDGSWATRKVYDGAEWWQHHIRPEIPENLR